MGRCLHIAPLVERHALEVEIVLDAIAVADMVASRFVFLDSVQMPVEFVVVGIVAPGAANVEGPC